ncbi:hypothetical protein SAMN04488498_11869 [Mesorhizobium albiziae]|uniref:Galactose mutarotase n=1 Tax=Neomesorhizobium albiziae TaxID=335020 RepID=A0A1I4DQK4_9HYPH|nr:hypothetical protein [Mesorhizobium albiziae]GLS31288.1 hypothetical protein GCM10007937_29980 [Mesorhizobium albiziae]SFK94316.1 hypothetical protein SAMN04488498_11869 [Mesorhizobium albiziae]
MPSPGVQAVAAEVRAGAKRDPRWRLGWDRGHAEIFATGAALHNLVFTFDDGSSFRPLAEAPWIDAPELTTQDHIPNHLKSLGGEWPCVPFGSTDIDPDHHGFGADNPWHVTAEAAGAIELAIDYPQDHPVARLERRIRGVAGRTAVDLELTVVTREDCLLPVGLHPIFRLPDAGKRMHFSVDGFSRGHTFPGVFEPHVSRLAAGREFGSLDAVPLAGGGSADLSQPPSDLREEIVLIESANGGMALGYPDDGFAVRLEWNRRDFPALVMWLSDRGRSTPPWSNRFRGVGIEPVNGFFDGTALAGHAPAGLALGKRFSAGERWTTHYRISASRIDAGQSQGKAR